MCTPGNSIGTVLSDLCMFKLERDKIIIQCIAYAFFDLHCIYDSCDSNKVHIIIVLLFS